jgi:hypothetical protein
MRIAVVLVGFLALSSCSPDVQSVATPKPTKANARVSGKPFVPLKRGYGVYMRHCAQCHEHRLPNTVSLPAWHAKIDTMSDLAGLSKEDHDSLQLYLGEFSDR